MFPTTGKALDFVTKIECGLVKSTQPLNTVELKFKSCQRLLFSSIQGLLFGVDLGRGSLLKHHLTQCLRRVLSHGDGHLTQSWRGTNDVLGNVYQFSRGK